MFSIAIYVLTGLRRDQARQHRGAFKYFLLGGFSSAFFLYGIAFTYGIAGSTHLDRVAAAVAAQALTGNPLLLVAMGLLLVGFAFKVSAVPFHMWTPDAYEGAPDDGHRLHVDGRQGRGLRRLRARVPARPSSRCAATGHRCSGCWRC